MTLNSNQLREMVRDVLREVLPAKAGATRGVEAVQITNDDDLAAFVRLVLARQDAITSGQLRFTLSKVLAERALPAGNVLQGVITEQIINHHAGAGSLILAAGAVVTPLARDRARKLGLKLERRR